MLKGRRKCVRKEWAVKGYDKVLKGTVEALDGDEKAITGEKRAMGRH